MKKALLITLLILSSTLVFSQFKFGAGIVYEWERKTSDLDETEGYYGRSNDIRKAYGIHGRISYGINKFIDVVAAADILPLKERYGSKGNRLRLNIHINVINNESFCVHIIGGYNTSKLGDYARATAPEFGLGVRFGQLFFETRYTDNKSINDGFISTNLGFHF